MPRSGWQKPETDQRLSDHLTIAMLTRAYPEAVVDAAIAATGRLEQRQRLLPARVVLYHVLAMALFEEASYEQVMRRLLEGLAWQQRWTTRWQVPTKAAIFKARTRLGVEPLAELYRRTVPPTRNPTPAGGRYRGRPVLTLDHVRIVLSGPGADPDAVAQILPVTGLVEAGSHVVLDVAIGRSPAEGARRLAATLPAGVVCLADTRTGTPDVCQTVTGRGSDLVWATAAETRAVEPAQLPDGSPPAPLTGPVRPQSAPSPVRDLGPAPRRGPWADIAGNAVAVIGPDPDQRGGPAESLLTTLLDPAEAPADELRRLYAGRATVTSCLEDLRVHQRSTIQVPRSHSAEGATQEFYGQLLAHFAIRSLLTSPPPSPGDQPSPA